MTRATLLLAGLMISATSSARAQDAPRMVSGRIFDDSTGCPLRAVQVTAVGSTVHVATDANGRYRMMNPPTGAFSLRVTLSGFQPQQTDGIAAPDSLARVDFSLFRTFRDGSTQAVYPAARCHLAPRDSL